ncbi:uncharacterized protein CANTADRAFT_53240 [Suhomyces tanzawaensis NRRL Y-17324]|uniref:RA-domain-containing protein n=1 Tax=Suhomyces tanzawaensis NRRL Y-17324 TaxID=984487 RepID=A0A1E4SG56_9ASCO|nr:uncharacterized protein CANTADRAFT_53240 [Suhomyces tanzawaensis NRRL Y-17324]ODV78494.1 hypothetical protein CANTADRAFT_53240 [Suhomyces tanzawaensis NRRL Y-17324]
MSSPSNESFLQWDPAQVASHVRSVLSEEHKGLAESFLHHKIEGSLLPFITTEHLKELGIAQLLTRLAVKKSFTDLITAHHQKYPLQSMNDPEYKLNNININTNYVSMESLSLSSVLMQDMFKKLGHLMQQQIQSSEPSPVSPNQNLLDIKRLNENFIKLKTDLIPVIRLLKDSKPLPTPTLDPGTSSSNVDSPTLSILSSQSESAGSWADPLSDFGTITSNSTFAPHRQNVSRSNSVSNNGGNVSNRSSYNLPSPTYSKRFSSGSQFSLGTGKIILQSIPKIHETRTQADFTLPKIIPDNSNKDGEALRPRLVETKSSSSTTTINTLGNVPGTPTTPTMNNTAPSQPSNEPLKQLRASTEDSCLKILQQAMKRHHIPRDDWSKYVLVICYGDKERILKLAEKPVIIFKELQELGKHPAIMLRQLATTATTETGSDELYEDSRIGDDIPGGTL